MTKLPTLSILCVFMVLMISCSSPRYVHNTDVKVNNENKKPSVHISGNKSVSLNELNLWLDSIADSQMSIYIRGKILIPESNFTDFKEIERAVLLQNGVEYFSVKPVTQIFRQNGNYEVSFSTVPGLNPVEVVQINKTVDLKLLVNINDDVTEIQANNYKIVKVK